MSKASEKADLSTFHSNIGKVKLETVNTIAEQLPKIPTKSEIDKQKAQTSEKIQNSLSKMLRGGNGLEAKDLLALGDLYGDRAANENGILLRRVKTNIPSVNLKGNDTNEEVLIRDCRAQDQNDVKSPHNLRDTWNKMALGAVAGAFSLIDSAVSTKGNNKDSIKKELLEIWDTHRKLIDTLAEKPGKGGSIDEQAAEIAANLNYQVAKCIEENEVSIPSKSEKGKQLKGQEKIMKAVALCRDYNNFKSRDQNVFTIAPSVEHKGKSYVGVQAEVRMHAVSPETEKELQKIKTYYESANKNPQEYKLLPKWFTRKSELEQKNIGKNIDSILAGNIVSSQIKGIPLTRNAHLHHSALISKSDIEGLQGVESDKVKQKIRSETTIEMPTSNPAHLKGNSKEQMDLTKRNMKYVQDLGGKNYKVDFTCTTTSFPWPLNKLIEEGKIVNLTQKAAKELNSHYTQAALAAPIVDKKKKIEIVMAPSREAARSQGLFAEMWSSLKNKGVTKKIVNFFCKSGKDRTGAVVRIMEPADKFTRQLIEKEVMEKYKGKFDEIVKDKTFSLNSQDKNTIDRLNQLTKQIAEETNKLAVQNNELNRKFAQSMINSGHAQEISGGPGGSIGINDLKIGGISKGLPKDHCIIENKKNLKGNLAGFNHLFKNAKRSPSVEEAIRKLNEQEAKNTVIVADKDDERSTTTTEKTRYSSRESSLSPKQQRLVAEQLGAAMFNISSTSSTKSANSEKSAEQLLDELSEKIKNGTYSASVASRKKVSLRKGVNHSKV